MEFTSQLQVQLTVKSIVRTRLDVNTGLGILTTTQHAGEKLEKEKLVLIHESHPDQNFAVTSQHHHHLVQVISEPCLTTCMVGMRYMIILKLKTCIKSSAHSLQ